MTDMPEQIAVDIAETMNDLLMSPMGVVPKNADWLYDDATGTFDARKIVALINDAVAAETEECARVVDRYVACDLAAAIRADRYVTCSHIAAAIRARLENP